MNARKLVFSALLSAAAFSAFAEPLPGEPGYPQPEFVPTLTRAEVRAQVGQPDTTSLYVFNGINLVRNPRLVQAPPAHTRQEVRVETREWMNSHRLAAVSPAYTPY